MIVSVVIAIYNGEQFIEEQMESIRTQTRQPDEVIIRDDCSTDNTPSIIADFIARHNLNWDFGVNAQNLGFANNFVQAAKKSQGGVIFFSDQDDVWHPEKVEKMTYIMEHNPHIECLASDRNIIDIYGQIIEKAVWKSYAKENVSSELTRFSTFMPPLLGRCFPGMCMATRKDLLSDYMLELSYGTYHDSAIQDLASAKGGLYFYDKVLASHRRNDGSVTGSYKRYHTRSIGAQVAYRQERLAINRLCQQLMRDRHDNFAHYESGYLQYRIRLEELRLLNLQQKRLVGTLLSFRFISHKRSYNTRNWVADIVYVLKAKRNLVFPLCI
jgi:glycosyltransferase involved in cell wall biosynthesis